MLKDCWYLNGNVIYAFRRSTILSGNLRTVFSQDQILYLKQIIEFQSLSARKKNKAIQYGMLTHKGFYKPLSRPVQTINFWSQLLLRFKEVSDASKPLYELKQSQKSSSI